MYIPDRKIVKLLKEYDPCLFIRWNNERHYFEVMCKENSGRTYVVTPVTQSIYDAKAPVVYAPLDERLLWWIQAADNEHSTRAQRLNWFDSRMRQFYVEQNRIRRERIKEFGSDYWQSLNNFFPTRHKAVNKYKFNTKRRYAPWVKPDVKNNLSRKLFSRSAQNARKYFGGR